MVTEQLPRKPGMTEKRFLTEDLQLITFFRTEDGGEEVEMMNEVSAEEVTAEQLKKRKLQEEEEEDGVVCIE